MNRRSLRLRKAPLSSAAAVGRPDIGLRCHSASLPVAVARLGLQIFQNRPQLRRFGQAYEDVSLMKTFAIAGRYNLEVRLDLLNAFNRHYLADPVPTSAARISGT